MKQVIGVDVNLGERKIVVTNSDFDKEKELLYIVSDKDFDNINDAFNYIVNIVYFDKEPKIFIDEPPTAILCRMIDNHYNRKNGKGDYILKLVDVELISPRVKNRTQ